MPPRIDMIGQRFGCLEVIGDAPSTCERRVIVRCDCGTEKAAGVSSLRSGASKSCGCKTAEFISAAHRTHGHATGYVKSQEYGIWTSMLRRCGSPRHKQFATYGGRGIYVCDRWRESFEAFFADMGARPSTAHTIDRIDNNGPYSPENCRWTTRAEQSRNTSRNINLTHNGETMCMGDWARRLGTVGPIIRSRLKHGWSPDAAVSIPVGAPEMRRRNGRAPCPKA